MGATYNLYLLKNVLVKIENIPIYQYSNYLSQVALCVELGLKSIIINTDDFERTHNLKKLFSLSPDAFQQKFKLLYPDDKTFDSNISNLEKIFEDFRYMQLKSNLNEYFDENMVSSNNTINLNIAINQPNFQFLRILLDEILEYEKFMWKENMKQTTNIDFSDVDLIIKQHNESSKNIQENIVLKQECQHGTQRPNP
jgi:hypothetical protein